MSRVDEFKELLRKYSNVSMQAMLEDLSNKKFWNELRNIKEEIIAMYQEEKNE